MRMECSKRWSSSLGSDYYSSKTLGRISHGKAGSQSMTKSAGLLSSRSYVTTMRSNIKITGPSGSTGRAYVSSLRIYTFRGELMTSRAGLSSTTGGRNRWATTSAACFLIPNIHCISPLLGAFGSFLPLCDNLRNRCISPCTRIQRQVVLVKKR